MDNNPQKNGSPESIIRWMEKLVFLELSMKQDRSSYSYERKKEIADQKKKVKKLLSRANTKNEQIIEAYSDFIVRGKIVKRQSGEA